MLPIGHMGGKEMRALLPITRCMLGLLRHVAEVDGLRVTGSDQWPVKIMVLERKGRSCLQAGPGASR
jgi:hypothetical protein